MNDFVRSTAKGTAHPHAGNGLRYAYADATRRGAHLTGGVSRLWIIRHARRGPTSGPIELFAAEGKTIGPALRPVISWQLPAMNIPVCLFVFDGLGRPAVPAHSQLSARRNPANPLSTIRSLQTASQCAAFSAQMKVIEYNAEPSDSYRPHPSWIGQRRGL